MNDPLTRDQTIAVIAKMLWHLSAPDPGVHVAEDIVDMLTDRQMISFPCAEEGCGQPESYHLHRPASEDPHCKAPQDHHVFREN